MGTNIRDVDKTRPQLGLVVLVPKLPPCDIHRMFRSKGYLLASVGPLARIDGLTQYGRWANMCLSCWQLYGTSPLLGEGHAQYLITPEEVKG